jgi:hypothetical protein
VTHRQKPGPNAPHGRFDARIAPNLNAIRVQDLECWLVAKIYGMA